jgi:NADH-quinone oxidoreductase subunit H
MDLLNNIPPHLFRMIIAVAVAVGYVFANATVMGYLERKLAGHFQRRPGPMEVGWHGILQMPVDGVKLIAKQLIAPDNVEGILFYAAPIIALAPVALPFLVIPFAPGLQVIDLDVGAIFILTMISFNTVAVFLAGWSSNNNYSMIGAMRAVAQNIAYEIPILLSLLAIALMTNSFSMKAIIEAQKNIWFIMVQPAAFIIMFICAIAETNRAPFDLAEAESELTAGFHTEYCGIAFSLFMIAEYTYMFVNCCLVTALFLGGWKGIPLPFGEYSSCIWFFAKVYLLMFIIIWCRWTFPRVRFDQLMNFAWKYLIPFSLVNLLLTAILVKLL